MTIKHESTWKRPDFGEPVLVEGLLTKAHFNGAPYVQLWGKNQPYCDHILDSTFRVMAGSYVKCDSAGKVTQKQQNDWVQQPFVVRPVSSVPTVMDNGKPIVWPIPPLSWKSQKGKEAELVCFGHFPADLYSLEDCEDCHLTVHLFGTCGDLWKMKGMGKDERGKRNTVEIVCGESFSTTAARCLGSENPNVTVHSKVTCHVQTLDSGMIVANPRSGSFWGECGGEFRCYGKFDDRGMTDKLLELGPTFEFAEIYWDDWWRNAKGWAPGGEVYVCGPDNTVYKGTALLDDRANWTKPHSLAHAKGNTFYEGCRTI